MMESVDKLRAYCDSLEGAAIDDNHVSAEYVAKRTAINVRRYADGIEQELEELYIKLPLDADGVPIHVGDFLESSEYKGKKFPCRGLNVEVSDGRKRWTVCMSYDPYSGTSEYTSANRCRHAKPRTVEDVLRELVDDALEGTGRDPLLKDWKALVGRYAAELRELMEVE